MSQNCDRAQHSASVSLLSDENKKIDFIFQSANLDIDADDVVSIKRIGTRYFNKSWPVKIVLKSRDKNYQFLNKRRHIAEYKAHPNT